jgi:hypothetical protein
MSKSATVIFLGVVRDADIYGRSGVAVDISQHDSGTVLVEHSRDLAADPLASSGDNCDALVQQ